MRARLALLVGSLSLLLAGCASQTLFQSNFGATPVGQAPAPMQAVGTAGVFGAPGGAVIAPSPIGTGGNFLQVNRVGQVDVGMQGKLAQFLGDGSYTFDATMYMPSGSGTASISFEPSSAPLGSPFSSFMHLDFLDSNFVRIDDITTTGLAFPRDQPFIVQVTLQIGSPQSTAHIVLAGAGTSGSPVDYTILPPFQGASHDFGAIRIWMGFDHHGPFDATNVVVTRRIQ